MIITNKHNLPKALVSFVSGEETFPKNTYRVTETLKGFREVLLYRRHRHEIVSDVSDMVWRIFGTAVHEVAAKEPAGDGDMKEVRLEAKFSKYTLSGKFDFFDKSRATVVDYKTCSVWKVIKKDYSDWRKQLLIYSWLLRRQGHKVRMGEVVAFVKDFSRKESEFREGYPKTAIVTIPFKFSEKDFISIEKFLTEYFKKLEVSEHLPDGELPTCSLAQRFNSGERFAVKDLKTGKQNYFDSSGEAIAFARGRGGQVQRLEGRDVKCTDYCEVNKFCSYYLKKYGGKKNGRT